jgi:hypothetical protein
MNNKLSKFLNYSKVWKLWNIMRLEQMTKKRLIT